MMEDFRRCRSVSHNGRWLACFLLAALLLALFNVPALAHKVTIFAWVEGDTVYTQSKFSGGKKAKNSTVVVYDKEGNLLLEGKTDDKGQFSFKVPKKTGLKVALKASMGHLAEWTIPADEITAGGLEGSAAEVGIETPSEGDAYLTAEPDTEGPVIATGVNLSKQEVQDLIDASLDRKLAPVVNMLVDSLDHGPRMSEVIGGIGYIFGLVGVGLYFSNRRKRKS